MATDPSYLVDDDALLPEEELQRAANFPLEEEDDQNMESGWHRAAIALLIESILHHFREHTDFYVGGNMFIYYSFGQAENRKFRGPDFFFVKESRLHPLRRYWIVWMEEGRYPDVIIELLSPTTAHEDRTTKKALYERTFRTAEYFVYDPLANQLEGWRLGKGRRYQPITPNEHGRLWSEELELWLGTWKGEYLRSEQTWLRFYDAQGHLVLHRAEVAEAELARLKAFLAQQGIATEPPGEVRS